MHILRRALLMLLVIGCLGFMLTGNTQPAYERYSVSFFDSFDTVITILAYAQDLDSFEQVTKQAEASFWRYHQLFDKYSPYEGIVNVYTLNREAAKAPQHVSDELFSLLKYAKSMYPATEGRVNIALGAVLGIWHEARDTAEADPDQAYLPDMAALKEAATHCNIDDLVLNEQEKTVFFADPLLQLDVGAVAKGYAVELVAQEMLNSNMPSFIINGGGNIRAGQPPMDGRANWGVAIQDPDGFALSDANSDILDVLFLHDCSVVTSGDYQRYYLYEGQRYHHIISPDSLMPPSYFRSVSVITQDSGYADLLSTALFLMPYEEGRAFVEALPDVEALWVLNDRSIQMTEGLLASARSQGATNP